MRLTFLLCLYLLSFYHVRAGCELSAPTITTNSELLACLEDNAIQYLLVESTPFNQEQSSNYLVTDAAMQIRFVGTSNEIALDALGAGTYDIRVITYTEISGLELGESAIDLSGCFVFSNSITATVEYCTQECQAHTGSPIVPEFACNNSLQANTSGANAAYPLYYLVTGDDGLISEYSTSGTFTGLTKGDYGLYLLSTNELDDANSLLGKFPEEIQNELDCFQLSDGTGFAALDSIKVSLEEDCSQDEGTYTLTISFEGGLPWYDFSSNYFVEGFTVAGQFAFDESITLEFAQNQPYEVIVTDNTGCPTVIAEGSPDPCSKFAPLIVFEGQAFGDYNRLSWATETEENSDYFEIFRSLNGFLYETIATLPAQGNSNVVVPYEYQDQPAPQQDFVYYKLKIYNLDGAFEESNTVIIERDMISGLDDRQIEWDVKVNDEQVMISSTFPQEETVIKIYDLNGRLLKSTEISGTNQFVLPINEIPMGMYLLQVHTIDQSFIKKFWKN